MAIQVMIPKEGSMENCIIAKWNFKLGDRVSIGDLICEVETDKSAFDLEAPGTGTILEIFYEDDSEVPVLSTIAIIGEAGEDYSGLIPGDKYIGNSKNNVVEPGQSENFSESKSEKIEVKEDMRLSSPRARLLAQEKNVPLFMLKGSGSEGSIVEKDVLRWLSENQPLTPAANEKSERLGTSVPSYGTGIGGRIMTADVDAIFETDEDSDEMQIKVTNDYTEIQVKGIRKVTAERMLSSLQTTAQYTLTTTADAEKLLACRSRFKSSFIEMSMRGITINDMLLYVVSRALAEFKEMNCHFIDNRLLQFKSINLAFAVDTSKGLIVPVIRKAEKLSLKDLSQEAGRLSDLCRSGKILPEDIKGGTFTLSNLGGLGIDTFTPILNPPQVAILGIGRTNLKAVSIEGQVCFKNHIELSLTMNHQIVDGASGARFLKLLSEYITNIDLLLMQ